MEVGETLGNAVQLVMGSDIEQPRQREIYKFKSICAWAPLGVFQQIPTRRPARDKLEGLDSNTHEG